MTRSAPLWLVAAAVAVNGPRLVLAFLAADRLPVDPGDRRLLLEVTAWATGMVLTVGAAYLAHAAATLSRYRGLLAACWLLVLAASGALIAPLLAAGLEGLELHQVLPLAWQRTAWAVLAVLAVEVVAGGGMVAYAATRQRDDELAGLYRELEEVARESNEANAHLHRAWQELDELRAQPAHQPEPGSSRLSRARLAEPAIPCRNGCGGTFHNRRAEAGHQRACPERDTDDREEAVA